MCPKVLPMLLIIKSNVISICASLFFSGVVESMSDVLKSEILCRNSEKKINTNTFASFL